ncbi:DUF2637 domain-containing protein [Streptomyces sp. NPDC001889]
MPAPSSSRVQLTRTHRILIAVVVLGVVVIAAIGFAGSYAAVRDLAERKGFGDFAPWFPIGIDAGICVLLALDLLLTWLRIPFPLLRQTAWLLTIATIVFNGAASWPDPLGMGMHAATPLLFIASIEAARHAVGRIADITADKHMEGIRLARWLLAPVPTFRLWRRMRLWELREYDQAVALERDRLVYQDRLKARYGRAWRRKATVEELLPLRLAAYGIPVPLSGAAEEPDQLVAQGSTTPAADLAAEPGPATVPVADTAPPAVVHAPDAEEPPPVAEPQRPGAERETADMKPPVAPNPPTARTRTTERAAVPPGPTGSTPPSPQPRRPVLTPAPVAADTVQPGIPAVDEHTRALGPMRNADAVRYATTVLGSFDTPRLVQWLKLHGKPVNRGQVYRVAEAAERKAAAQAGQPTPAGSLPG